MKDVNFRLSIDEAGTFIRFEIIRNGNAVVSSDLEAVEVQELIRELANIRQMMADAVPAELDTNFVTDALYNPGWRIPEAHRGRRKEAPEGKLLALRHPGYGWLSFLLPLNEATGIAEWLTKP